MIRLPAALRVSMFAFSALAMSCADEPAPDVAPPGMTWESIRTLPDFAGWWEWIPADEDRARGPGGQPQGPPRPLARAPFKPEVIQPVVAAAARLQDASLADRREETGLLDVAAACLPPVYFGTNGDFFQQFEMLFTPGRVTIASEHGLLRRVALGRPMPAEIVESDAGTSVGRWEGDALVVETTGISSDRRAGPFRVGKGVHFVERFELTEPDVLSVTLRMTAPELFTQVYERTFTYRRNRDHEFQPGDLCVMRDRSFDHTTRRERFDATPPDDLPPPPID